MKCLPFKSVLYISTIAFIFESTSEGQMRITSLSPLDEVQPADTPVSVPDNAKMMKSAETTEDRNVSLDTEKPEPAVALEGIQVLTEPGDKPTEKIVTCFFIFNAKPSGFSHKVERKERKIVFEFNGVTRSAIPVPIDVEPPIENFFIEEEKADIAKDENGSTPRYRSKVRLEITVSVMPKICVYDDQNIISFSYVWSTDAADIDKYAMRGGLNTKAVLWLSAAGIGTGVLTCYFFLRPAPNRGEGKISIDDLPIHN